MLQFLSHRSPLIFWGIWPLLPCMLSEDRVILLAFLMFLFIFFKCADEYSRIASINAVRWDILCHNRPCSDNYIVADSCVTQNNAACTNKNVISNLDDSDFCMHASQCRACVMCQEFYIWRQCHIISYRNQPRPIRINRIATVILEVFPALNPCSKQYSMAASSGLVPPANNRAQQRN